jgi:hypothetical protein
MFWFAIIAEAQGHAGHPASKHHAFMQEYIAFIILLSQFDPLHCSA